MDAWGGIIGAMKISGKSKWLRDTTRYNMHTDISKDQVLQPYVQSIFHLLNLISQDMNRSESLMRSSMGVIG